MMIFKIKRLMLDIKRISNPYLFDNYEALYNLTKEITRIVNSRIVETISKKYEPQGFSMLTIIEDSTISIHTYPEKSFISIDVHTCMEKCNTLDVVKYIEDTIGGEVVYKYFEDDLE